MIITRNDPTTSKGIHVQNGLGDGEGGDTDRPLAALYLFPGHIKLDALKPGSLSCAQDVNSGDKADLNSIRFSSNGSGTDSVLRLEFQPDSSFTVSSAEFTFHIREPPKVDVASSVATDSKAIITQGEEKDSVSSLMNASQGNGGTEGMPGGDVLIKRSMIEATRKSVKSRTRRHLQEEDSGNIQDALVAKDRILDTPAMETRYIDPQAVHENFSEFDASAVHTGVTGTGPTQSGSGVTSIQDLPADIPDSMVNPESDLPETGSPPADEPTTPSHSMMLRETPATRDNSLVREKPESPSPEQLDEFFSAPTHPPSRKRKHALTYAVTRSSKKKQKVQSPAEGKGDDPETNSDDDAESTIVARPILPSEGTKRTPKVNSRKSALETLNALVKKQQPRRTRLSGSSADSAGKFEGPAPRVVFTNSIIPSQNKYMNFLKKQNVKIVDVISESSSSADIVCVGDGELKRTSKLTLGVLLGKTIITDKWVTDSHQAGHLLNPVLYLPHDPEHETKWNFNLHEAIERGKQGIKVFKDWTIHFAPSMTHQESKDTIKELTVLVRTAGGKVVTNRNLPKEPPPPPPATEEDEQQQPATLIIAAAAGSEDDEDLKSLTKSGWSVYTRDIISLSILRGKVEVDSEEFKIHVNKTTGSKSRASVGGKEKRGRLKSTNSTDDY